MFLYFYIFRFSMICFLGFVYFLHFFCFTFYFLLTWFVFLEFAFLRSIILHPKTRKHVFLYIIVRKIYLQNDTILEKNTVLKTTTPRISEISGTSLPFIHPSSKIIPFCHQNGQTN